MNNFLLLNNLPNPCLSLNDSALKHFKEIGRHLIDKKILYEYHNYLLTAFALHMSNYYDARQIEYKDWENGKKINYENAEAIGISLKIIDYLCGLFGIDNNDRIKLNIPQKSGKQSIFFKCN